MNIPIEYITLLIMYIQIQHSSVLYYEEGQNGHSGFKLIMETRSATTQAALQCYYSRGDVIDSHKFLNYLDQSVDMMLHSSNTL